MSTAYEMCLDLAHKSNAAQAEKNRWISILKMKYTREYEIQLAEANVAHFKLLNEFLYHSQQLTRDEKLRLLREANPL
jgi:hypothetical protein